jgi:hypothetical protein
MAKTLNQLIGYEAIMGTVETIRSGLPTDGLPSQFFTLTRAVDGHQGVINRVEGTRTVARQAAYGSPSRRTALQGLKQVPVTLPHFPEHIVHEPTVLSQLRDMNSPARQAKGQAEVDQHQRGDQHRLRRAGRQQGPARLGWQRRDHRCQLGDGRYRHPG